MRIQQSFNEKRPLAFRLVSGVLAGVFFIALFFACTENEEEAAFADGDETESADEANDVESDDLDETDETQEEADDDPPIDGDIVEEGEEAEEGNDASNDFLFHEYEWLTSAPDVNERLCKEAADPEGAEDKIFIDCRLEGESFLTEQVPPKDEIIVMAYNIERGYHADEQLDRLLNDPAIPTPDVLLLIESDRGCSRTQKRHITRDYAMALSMNYVYAVEFTELAREGGPGGTIEGSCEHGNAILSHYPIGNVRAMRHQDQRQWYDTSEPRLGGRVAVVADIKIGERYRRFYAIHFESDISQEMRTLQAIETAEDGLASPIPVVIGGDYNSGLYAVDLRYGTDSDTVIDAMIERGYQDTHAPLDAVARVTSPESGFVLDLLFANGDFMHAPGVCPKASCEGLSDHLPVWATMRLVD